MPVRRPHPRLLAILALTGLLLGPPALEGQRGDPSQAMVSAYVRVVAAHFGLAPGEASLLVDEGLLPEELPVVLLLARESGFSPAVIVSRRMRQAGGAPWASVADQVGLGASVFHVQVPEDERDDRAREALAAFESTPRAEWDALRLSDDEAVTLANVRALSGGLQVGPGEALDARERAGSWVGSVQFLLGVP